MIPSFAGSSPVTRPFYKSTLTSFKKLKEYNKIRIIVESGQKGAPDEIVGIGKRSQLDNLIKTFKKNLNTNKMMRIKKIRFIDEVKDEVKDQLNESIDVGIEFEDGSSYTIIVRTPGDLIKEILQEGTNFINPSTPVIVVKELTKKMVNEAIEAYAEDEGYWLKLCQFGDELDIAILNKLDAEYREESNEY